MSIIRRKPRPTSQTGSGAAEPPPDETTLRLAALAARYAEIEAERRQLHGRRLTDRAAVWGGLVSEEATVQLPVVDRPLSGV